MKQYFIVSLCKEGILGGGIIADDGSITYKTGKLTISPKLRNLKMKYENIKGISEAWLLCFPTVSITMDDGERYKFIVFRRKRFCELLESKMQR